jgi:hypothetical protein
MLASGTEKLQGMSTYIDGKLKRYNLLFTVNAGAFVIGQIVKDNPQQTWGGLALWHVALGAMLFTVIMAVDIYLFAAMMKRHFLGELIFNTPGKAVLVLLCLIVIGGWWLAAF